MLITLKWYDLSLVKWSGRKISEVWEVLKKRKRNKFSFISPDVSPPNGKHVNLRELEFG